MNDEQVQSLWNQGKRQEPRMDVNAINRILEKSVRSGWSRLRLNLRISLAVVAVAGLFNILNLAGSASHPGWLAVHASLAAATLGFFVFGLRVLRESRALDDASASVAVLVRKQLHFFHRTFEGWLWAWALMIWVLVFSVTVWMENQRGGYHLDHVVELVAVSAGLIFGSYALLRLGHTPMVHRSLAALHDLDSQLTEQTERLEARRKYWVIGAVLLVLALAAVVVWTIRLWLLPRL